MSRININDKLWADPRFDALKIMVGNEFVAIGLVVKAFRMAQEFWSDGEKLIPLETWKIYPFDSLEKSGLAEVTEAGVYVKGSKENFDWLLKKRAAARVGGLKSVQVRQEKYGTKKILKSVENEAHHEAPHEAPMKHNMKQCFVNDEAPMNPPSPSPSPSLNTNTLPQKKSTTSKKQSIGTVDVIARYCELFEQRHGTKAVISGVEAGQLGRLTKSHGKDQAIKIVEAYFKLPDQWIINQCHPVSMIEKQINKILVHMAKKEPERRWLEIPTGENQ